MGGIDFLHQEGHASDGKLSSLPCICPQAIISGPLSSSLGMKSELDYNEVSVAQVTLIYINHF